MYADKTGTSSFIFPSLYSDLLSTLSLYYIFLVSCVFFLVGRYFLSCCVHACMCHILFLKRCDDSLAYYFHSSSIRMHFVLCLWFVLSWIDLGSWPMTYALVRFFSGFLIFHSKSWEKKTNGNTDTAHQVSVFLIPHHSVAISMYRYEHCCIATYIII